MLRRVPGGNPRAAPARQHRGRLPQVGCLAALLLLPLLAGAQAPRPQAGYAWTLPPGFPVPLVPADNPMSTTKVALGCRLFFDTQLSVNGSTSCATCHQPEFAYTDRRARAIGATGGELRHAAMSLANVAYNPGFNWADSRSSSLEQQMHMPLFNEQPVELGLRGRERQVEAYLGNDADYARAFGLAFPESAAPISIEHLIQAIAAYERTLISGRSAFDRYVFDGDHAALSPGAKRGMALFYADAAGCSDCHSGLNFSGPLRHAGAATVQATYANTGIGADRGLAEATRQRRDAGRFRVPTLRNIALTAPYMHDGSLPTLEAVLDHYAGIGTRTGSQGRRLDPRLKARQLSAEQRGDLLAFLQSLTDLGFADPTTACARR